MRPRSPRPRSPRPRSTPSRPRSRRLAAPALGAVALGLALWITAATGQPELPKRDQRPRDAPGEPPQVVLHEYVPTEGELQSLVEFVQQTGAHQLPPGFKQDGASLARPDDGLAPRREERTISRMDRRTRRDERAGPDRQTRHEGELHYQAVFNPSVVPFKRVTSLDAVDPRFVLLRQKPRYAPVSLTTFTGSPDRTLFWGSVLVRGRRSETLPLPSVAPDMAIHGYETVPQGREVAFFKDGADNFAVRLARGGKLRLRFLVSAPRRYFNAAVPEGLTLADVPASRRPAVPAAVGAATRRMHQRLGLRPDAPLAALVDRLVAHFRAFEEGPLAVNTGNTYEDLTVSQRGVCRHRSYAFVITSLALGLPARYVTNEAHAFVEVWIPRTGWARIDLGGAANELNVSGARDRAVHRPVEDPFPKPPAYGQNYSRLNGAVTGLTARQRRGPRPRTGHGARRKLDPSQPGPAPGPAADPARPSPRATASPPTPTPTPTTTPVALQVEAAVSSGLRGEPLTVRGRITHGRTGAPLARRPVELLLRKPGSKDLIILGETVSQPDGGFTLVTTVPLATRVGTYQVVAYSPADKQHQAGWSRSR